MYSDALKIKAKDKSDDNKEITEFLIEKFIEIDLFQAVEDGDLDILTKSISRILGEYLSGDVKCQLELEKTSSLAMEITGIQFLDLVPGKDEEDSNEPSATQPEQIDPRFAEIESQATHIIPGRLIVAPVKGKYLNDVELGENIMVVLDTKNSVAAKLINILNARDKEGNLLPVKGRLKAKIPMEKSGYTLYALVAKSVLAKIVEDENVKIRMEDAYNNGESSGEGNSFFIVVLLVALIVIIGVIVIFALG